LHKYVRYKDQSATLPPELVKLVAPLYALGRVISDYFSLSADLAHNNHGKAPGGNSPAIGIVYYVIT